jgi:hypothetical protein
VLHSFFVLALVLWLPTSELGQPDAARCFRRLSLAALGFLAISQKKTAPREAKPARDRHFRQRLGIGAADTHKIAS